MYGVIGAPLTESVVLGQHDFRTIKTLIGKIEGGLDEIKARSISSLHTKLKSGIVTIEQLCVFEELPGACLNWINDHPGKSQLLLKVLYILDELSKLQRGCLLLKQYEALEFLEDFRKHLSVRETNVQEYLQRIEATIVRLLPSAEKVRSQQPENDPDFGNSRTQDVPQMATDKPLTVPEQPRAAPVRFSEVRTTFAYSVEFVVPRSQLDQPLERQIFDLAVQLKYGNKKLQFETLRMIKDFIRDYPADSFRNRTELLGELGRLLEEGVYPNECAEILTTVFRGLVRQQVHCASWEFKPLLPSQVQPTSKFQFPLKHSVLKSVYSQPLLQLICESFRKEWFDWLSNVQAEWCAPYLMKCLKTLPMEYLRERQAPLLKMAPVLLASRTIQDQWEWLASVGLLQARQFQERQQVNSMKAAYNKIRQYDHRLGQFLPHRHLHNFPKLLANLEEGLAGLAYCPQMVSVYIETLLYLSIASFKEEPLKEYYEPHLKTVLAIASHPSRKVRVKLYELLLQKAYLESNIEYLSTEFTASQLTLSMLTDERILLKLFGCSLDQPESTVFMLQLAKLLYLHHSRQVHHLFVRLVPLLNILTQLPDQKVSRIAKQIMEKFSSKELTLLHTMNIFSKEPVIREDVCRKLFEGSNYSSIMSTLQDITTQNKRNLKLKPLAVDEDSLLNCMNIAVDVRLEQSVRVSAINELLQMVERAESIPPAATTRLQNTNDTLLNQAIRLDANNALLPHILGLNISLVLLPYGCKLFDNRDLMLVWLKNGAVALTEYRILALLYLNCFRNPFCERIQERCLSQHWITCSDRFVHVVSIRDRTARQQLNIDINAEENAAEQDQPTVSNLAQVDSLLRFIYAHILHREAPFKIPFDEISQVIGSALAPNAPDYSLSLLRSLFELYDKKAQHFQALPEEFMSHSVPSLLNVINRQGSSRYFNMDALRIMVIAGVGSAFPKGIQQHNNSRYMEILTASQDSSLRMELFCSVAVFPQALLEGTLKLLPTTDTPTLTRACKKIIARAAEVKALIDSKDYARLALFTSLLKSLQQPNVPLKLSALQILLEILDERALDEHPSVLNIALQLVLEGHNCSLVVIGALKLLRKIQSIQPQYEHDRLEKLGVPSLIIDRLNNQQLPYLCYQAFLNVLNILLINSSLFKKYDVVELLTRLFYRTAVSLNKKELLTDTLCLLSEICCSFMLLSNSDQLFQERLLSSTNVLQTSLSIIEKLEEVASNPTRVSKAELGKTLSRLAQVIHLLSQQEDLFVFNLNKLINKSAEEAPKNIISYLAKFLPICDSNYHRMLSRLITIWHKGHPSLDRDGLGATIYDQLKKSGQSLTNNLLAISNTAKQRFVVSGDFDKLISRALLLVDAAFVEDLKQSKQPKRKEDVSVSRLSKKPAAESQQLRQVLLSLKSFFHPCQHSTQEIRLPSNNLVGLLQKLFQVCSSKKRQQEFTELKKALCNLSCNSALSRDVFSCLLSSKSQFVSELITVCSRSDEQFSNVFKQSLEVLMLFVGHPEIRALIYRSRLLHDFSGKLQKTLDFKANPNLLHEPAKLRYLDEVVKFWLAVSAFKDSHTKIITDKHLFDQLVLLAQSQDIEMRQLSTHTLMLLANLSYSKHNKAMFVGNKELHRVIMATLTAAKACQQHKKLMLQLLYNLLYKSAAAIKIYKRKEVLAELHLLGSTLCKNPPEKETLDRVLQILNSDYS